MTNFIKELNNGKSVRISKRGYTPSTFWFSNWNKTINVFNRDIGGAFEHNITKEELAQHIENMIKEKFTIELIDMDKNTTKVIYKSGKLVEA